MPQGKSYICDSWSLKAAILVLPVKDDLSQSKGYSLISASSSKHLHKMARATDSKAVDRSNTCNKGTSFVCIQMDIVHLKAIAPSPLYTLVT